MQPVHQHTYLLTLKHVREVQQANCGRVMEHHLHVIVVPRPEEMEEEAIHMVAHADQVEVLQLDWHIPVRKAVEHMAEVAFAEHHRWKSRQVFAHVVSHDSRRDIEDSLVHILCPFMSSLISQLPSDLRFDHFLEHRRDKPYRCCS